MVSDHLEIDLELPAKLSAEYQDKLGDDNGPTGNYLYPTHPSFTRQMDIEAVRIIRLGNNLKVEITMKEITKIWLPPNGFDHALINIYIDVPGKEGIRVLPFQNAEMPGGGTWDYMVSVAGFGNLITSSEGASGSDPGQTTGPTPFASAEIDNRTITFLIAAEAIGYPSNLSGSKFYITTWDGGPHNLRTLNPEPGEWTMGGGTDQDPKIMDDTEIIILR
jgi:carbohydrate-binding DOMON domain-containing protein